MPESVEFRLDVSIIDMMVSNPDISVVIPSLDGVRAGAVARLLESIARQTFKDYEVILVKGVSPQGRAINQGVAQAAGRYILIVDDDSELAGPDVFARLLAACESDPRIGMAGAGIGISPDTTGFQRRAACQFPRFCAPDVDEVTDSDFPCHGCCLIPAGLFREIGGEREDIVRGLDPDLRVRIRQAGYRVVLVPGARIYHPLPARWVGLLRLFFRNGFGSAYAYRFQPDTVYETGEYLRMEGFRPRRSFGYRAVRFPLRLAYALMRGRFMRFGGYVAYGWGYIWGLLTAKRMERGPS